MMWGWDWRKGRVVKGPKGEVDTNAAYCIVMNGVFWLLRLPFWRENLLKLSGLVKYI